MTNSKGFYMRVSRFLARNFRGRKGLTILELLIAASAIGVVLALMLPAIQASREAARGAQCKSHLHQLAQAVHNHEGTYQALPSGGWGWQWIGEPDRGVGIEQPGGWVYQILPYIDQQGLRHLGGVGDDSAHRASLADLSQAHLSLLRCPTRSAPDLPHANPKFPWINADWRPTMGRTDYAGNAGDLYGIYVGGPASLIEGDGDLYDWPDTGTQSGVFFTRSALGWKSVSDGLSSTYLLGEKRVSTQNYQGYADRGYDQSPFCGADIDVLRWTELPAINDSTTVEWTAFGSAHPGVYYMALCDGSVRGMNVLTDRDVHRRLGNRSDGHEIRWDNP